MVEQSTRLKGLRFETDPQSSAREMQPVLDGQGRIAGFFTWERTHPMTRTMGRLMPLIGRHAPSRWSDLPASPCGSCGARAGNLPTARSRRAAPPTATS